MAAIATEEDAKEDEEDEEDEEAAKARRKAEKRAKREARRKEADQPRPAPQAAVIEEEDVAFEAPSEPLMASGSRSPSPAPSDHERLATPDIEMDAITAFPLPEGPPKVDPAVLTAQAMPPALRDAKIVREDTRVALDDFTYTRRDWKGKGRAETTGTVSEEMKAKLRAMGVEDLFPGALVTPESGLRAEVLSKQSRPPCCRSYCRCGILSILKRYCTISWYQRQPDPEKLWHTQCRSSR